MSASAAKWLLASVIVARSSSFLFSKFILVSMNPFELLGLRFLLAFAFLLLVYRKRVMRTFSWDMVRKGAILGITLALGMAAEMLSLKETDVYLTAFLENMALAIVPLLTMAALRKLPSGKIIASVFIISVGAGFLTLKGGRPDITPGVIYGLLAALSYAFFIFLTAKYVKTLDPLSVGIWQMGFMGLSAPSLPFRSVRLRCRRRGARSCTFWRSSSSARASALRSSRSRRSTCRLRTQGSSVRSILSLRRSGA